MCFATIHHFNATHSGDPKRYVQEILGVSKTQSDLARSYTILNAAKIPPDKAFRPKDLNKKLADAILGSAEKSRAYLKSSAMSKLLRELTDDGLFLNICDKKKIKSLAPQTLPKQIKGGGYDTSKPEGYYSFYKISDDLAALKQVISNPEALKFIYDQLKKYGVLQKYYEFLISSWLYTMLESDDERFYKFATIAVQSTFDNKEIHPSEWRQIKQYLISLKEEEFQDLVKNMVAYQLQSPVNHGVLLLSILG